MKSFDSLRGRKHGYIDYDKVKKYAVMVALIEDENGKYNVLFEKRAADLDRQPGEICLPGGHREGLESAYENAVRETCEELLITPDDMDVICQLDTMRSSEGADIASFLCILKNYKGTFDPLETEEVFTVPLDFFLNTEPKCFVNSSKIVLSEDFPINDIPGGKDYHFYTNKYTAYFYYYEDKVIWGLTAYILKGMARVLKG